MELPASVAQRRRHLVEAHRLGQASLDQQIEHHLERFGKLGVETGQVTTNRGTDFERPEPLVHHGRPLRGEAFVEVDREQAL
jgi:hypothetical protein